MSAPLLTRVTAFLMRAITAWTFCEVLSRMSCSRTTMCGEAVRVFQLRALTAATPSSIRLSKPSGDVTFRSPSMSQSRFVSPVLWYVAVTARLKSPNGGRTKVGSVPVAFSIAALPDSSSPSSRPAASALGCDS